MASKDINDNIYIAQTCLNTPGHYDASCYKGLGANVLNPALLIGDETAAFDTIDVTGIPHVDTKLFSVKVSPVMGWLGQDTPGREKGDPPRLWPAEPNPDISWLLDFNTADLYTYGTETPGTQRSTDALGNPQENALWDDRLNLTDLNQKNFIYEGAPVKGPSKAFIEQDGQDMSLPPEVRGGGMPPLGYPWHERQYNLWGKDTVEDPEQINFCRPVKGWPMRIQRIPLCIPVGGEDGPLVSLTGDCSGGLPSGDYCVSGYYYTLATDPVLFTGAPEMIDDPDNPGAQTINPEHYQGKTFQWISETGLLPLNAGCGGGAGEGEGVGGGMCIAGVRCEYNPDMGYGVYPPVPGGDYVALSCEDPGCLIFDELSFGIEPEYDENYDPVETPCGSGYRVYGRGITVTIPPIEGGHFAPCDGAGGGGGGGGCR